MSIGAEALVLRQHQEVWSRGKLEVIPEIFAPTFVGHHPGRPDWIGPNGVREAVNTIRTAFPDFSESIEDVIVDGDKVVTRFTASGTHLGVFRDLAPTGRRVAIEEIGIFRIASGKIVEKWGLIDRLGLFEQLGAPPGGGARSEFLYEITMDVDVEDLGVTPAGRRRIVSVKGGTFEGPKLRGRVLPGGGDWLVERADGVRTLDVRITLRTEDGHLVYAHYPGLFHSPPDVAQRLTQGELVDPSEYYFRTAPLFETASDKYAWLNRILAVGIGRRMPGQVGYTVYAIL